MSDLVLPLAAEQLLARLAVITEISARETLVLNASVRQTPGLTLMTATSIGQVQATVGLRRPFNPYAY